MSSETTPAVGAQDRALQKSNFQIVGWWIIEHILNAFGIIGIWLWLLLETTVFWGIWDGSSEIVRFFEKILKLIWNILKRMVNYIWNWEKGDCHMEREVEVIREKSHFPESDKKKKKSHTSDEYVNGERVLNFVASDDAEINITNLYGENIVKHIRDWKKEKARIQTLADRIHLDCTVFWKDVNHLPVPWSEKKDFKRNSFPSFQEIVYPRLPVTDREAYRNAKPHFKSIIFGRKKIPTKFIGLTLQKWKRDPSRLDFVIVGWKKEIKDRMQLMETINAKWLQHSMKHIWRDSEHDKSLFAKADITKYHYLMVVEMGKNLRKENPIPFSSTERIEKAVERLAKQCYETFDWNSLSIKEKQELLKGITGSKASKERSKVDVEDIKLFILKDLLRAQFQSKQDTTRENTSEIIKNKYEELFKTHFRGKSPALEKMMFFIKEDRAIFIEYGNEKRHLNLNRDEIRPKNDFVDMYVLFSDSDTHMAVVSISDIALSIHCGFKHGKNVAPVLKKAFEFVTETKNDYYEINEQKLFT